VRKWHFQIVHHGLWDYDNPSPPNLVTIKVDGRSIDAVVQLTKQGFAFVFDRRHRANRSGPIEERRVAAERRSERASMPGRRKPFSNPAARRSSEPGRHAR